MDFKIVTDNKQLSEELAQLLEVKGELSLSLTLPLEKLNPLRETNERKLAPEDWSGTGVFQAGINCRVDLGSNAFFIGGLDYRYLSPKFKTDSQIIGIVEATQKMSTLKLGIGLGIAF
jgi:hypothetical protein